MQQAILLLQVSKLGLGFNHVDFRNLVHILAASQWLLQRGQVSTIGLETCTVLPPHIHQLVLEILNKLIFAI